MQQKNAEDFLKTTYLNYVLISSISGPILWIVLTFIEKIKLLKISLRTTIDILSLKVTAFSNF